MNAPGKRDSFHSGSFLAHQTQIPVARSGVSPMAQTVVSLDAEKRIICNRGIQVQSRPRSNRNIFLAMPKCTGRLLWLPFEGSGGYLECLEDCIRVNFSHLLPAFDLSCATETEIYV